MIPALHPRAALDALVMSEPLSVSDTYAACWHDSLANITERHDLSDASGVIAFIDEVRGLAPYAPAEMLAEVIAAYGGIVPTGNPTDWHLMALAGAFLADLRAAVAA